MRNIVRGIPAAALLMLAMLAGCSTPVLEEQSYRKAGAPIYSIAAFDPARLPGTWTEVASFAPEGTRCRPGGLTITRGAGGLQASGRLCRAGHEVGQNGKLSPIGPGRLWLSGADEPLWVVWVDTDYRTLVLGTPSGHFGWILNRGGALPPDRLKAAREILDWNGYDLSKLRVLR